jgi:hypothetical protein
MGSDDGRDGEVLGQAQLEPTGTGDDEAHDGPGERQAARLPGEAPDDLGPPPHFPEGALQQVRGTQPGPEAQRVAEMDGERRQVVGQAGCRAGVLPFELAHEDPQPGLSLGRADGDVERRPVGGSVPGLQPGALGELWAFRRQRVVDSATPARVMRNTRASLAYRNAGNSSAVNSGCAATQDSNASRLPSPLSARSAKAQPST